MLDYRPNVNGMAIVDLVEHAWPDHMGDSAQETMLFGAWAMGQFGPFTFPGGLERAQQQCWSWETGAEASARHAAFIRVRTSYAFGADDEAPVFPDDYEPIAELEFVTQLVSALLELPDAICYFNPNGEVLRDQDGLRESLNFSWAHQLPPLEVWSNIRLFNLNPSWSLMDTVGNGQLDIRDLEACFHTESYEFDQVDNFLRNVSLYLLQNPGEVEDGDTLDGPGEMRWQALKIDAAITVPPRDILRLLPLDDRERPGELSTSANSDDDEP